jgi:hypothetical protein
MSLYEWEATYLKAFAAMIKQKRVKERIAEKQRHDALLQKIMDRAELNKVYEFFNETQSHMGFQVFIFVVIFCNSFLLLTDRYPMS